MNIMEEYEKIVQENTALKNQISVLKNENIELRAQLNNILEELKLLKLQKWGKSSEKTDLEQDIFNEAEVTNDLNNDIAEIELEEIKYARKKKKISRNKKLEELPVEVIEYYLTEDQCNCPECAGGKLHVMKKELRRELVYEPAKYKVIEHVTYVYCCRLCNEYEENATILKAESPNALIPKSIASASLVAYILYEKYTMATPLYRLEGHFRRYDIQISRQVLASWVIKVAMIHLVKIYNAMKEILLQKEVLFSDDTEIQVLKEPGRSARTKSFMWVYISVMEEKIYLFEYTRTRAREHPEKFLKEFSGFMHVDGYSSYEKIPGIILVGCFAHARRKFIEAVNTLPKEKRTNNVASVTGLNYCNKLFKIENEIIEKLIDEYGENYSTSDINVAQKVIELRKKLSQPVLDEMKSWLDSIEQTVVPQSTLGKAVNYCLNQWNKLTGFMLDGRLELSNNRSERTIKNYVIGRKNWLFADTPSGATASAIIYSIAETAKENNLNIYMYFKYILGELQNIEDDNVSRILPWSDNLPEDVRMKPP